MTKLAHRLGLSQALSFTDVYSLTDPDLLAIVPRPCSALLFIAPETPDLIQIRIDEDKDQQSYTGAGADQPVIWFRQTIRHACGLIGLLHGIMNDSAADFIQPNSDLHKLRDGIIPLQPVDRAKLLYDSEMLERVHAEAAQMGDTVAPDAMTYNDGHAFIAYVKGRDGHLYELEGRRKGPVDRGLMEKDEDVLSEAALKMGPLRFVARQEQRGKGLQFSCIALGPSLE